MTKYIKKAKQRIKNKIKKIIIKAGKHFFKMTKNNIRYYKRSYKYLIKIANVLDENIKHIYPESERLKRDTPENLYNKLTDYDVISFDIFDTLIFRTWSSPKDIYEIMGLKLNIQNFKGIRSLAESEARKNIQFPIHEVTIDEIYDLVSLKCGIDKQTGIDLEFSTEMQYCFANPYMKQVFEMLKKDGKTIIATSDMYFSKTHITELLENCGYTGLTDIFISSEYDCTKVDGRLQQLVSQKMGSNLKFIHIGDNRKSDITASSKRGWNTIFYENVNNFGKNYRPDKMSSLGGGFYRGLVNQRLYSGIPINNPYYEFGYVYMGILICGYCEWLNRIAYITNCEKILFAARDMYIVEQIYNAYFKQYDNEYIQISRMTALKMDFQHESEMMFWNIKKNISLTKPCTIAQALTNVELEFLIEDCKNTGITPETIITEKNASEIYKILYLNKQKIIDHFSEERQCAADYFSSCIGKAKNVLFADTNGRCTSIYALQHLMNDINPLIHITGALIYSVSNPGYIDAKLSNHTLFSYICSNINNQDIYDMYRLLGEKSTQIIEAIFTSNKGTLKSYKRNKDGNIKMEYYDADLSTWQQRSAIHDGIKDFAKMYHRFNGGDKSKFNISPIDAWTPLSRVIFDDKFINKYFKELKTSLALGTPTNCSNSK